MKKNNNTIEVDKFDHMVNVSSRYILGAISILVLTFMFVNPTATNIITSIISFML